MSRSQRFSTGHNRDAHVYPPGMLMCNHDVRKPSQTPRSGRRLSFHSRKMTLLESLVCQRNCYYLLFTAAALSRQYTVIRDVTMDMVEKLNSARNRSSLESRYPFSAYIAFHPPKSEINDSPSSRHPVLLAVDGFQALPCQTRYREPIFATICSYHLSMPRRIMEYASGKRSFVSSSISVPPEARKS